MKYFRLHFFVNYSSGKNGGCLYNMHTNKMIYISKEKNEILQKAENNEAVDEENEFLQELYASNLGSFYDSKVVVEKTRIGAGKEYEKVATPKLYVNHAYIQITNECGGDCVFCDSGNKVYTKTRCKKWKNKETNISVEKWAEVFTDLHSLNCNYITFIGGDPLLDFQRVCFYVELAKAAGINNFEIYSNFAEATEDMIDHMVKNNIALNAQLFDLSVDTGATGIPEKRVVDNLKLAIKKGLEVKASILITKYNENNIEKNVEILREIGVNHIKTDFYYENSDNDHFSEKFKNEMYKKQFFTVNKISFAFLEKYNNCIYGKVSINLEGNVTPCPMMNDHVIGNIAKENIRTILGKPEYQTIIRMTRDSIENCGNCAFKLNCIDCRALESNVTGKINGMKYCSNLQELKAGV